MTAFRLSPQKKALLETLRREEGLAAQQPAPLPRREAPDTAPLSSAQQRLWILSTLHPESPQYNLAMALDLLGPLDVGALTRALGALVQRHEALRVTFEVQDGEPRQRIAAAAATPLSVIDLAGLGGETRAAETRRLVPAEARIPFDLASGPLLRGRLLSLAADRHVLVLTAHHIVVDGWSQGLLVQDLAAFYRACLTGSPVDLPPLAVHHPDYAEWEQRRWRRGELEPQRQYWLRQLAGRLPALELPLDRRRPPVPSFRGAHLGFRVDLPVSEGLRALSRSERVTPFATLLAAYAVLLYRHSGQAEVMIGTPTANRGRPELQAVVGCFPNLLALRCDLSGNPPFREVMTRSQEFAVAAIAHQEMPFDALVEALVRERDARRHPLFQAAFVLHERPRSDLDLPGLTLEPLRLESGVAKFELMLEIVPTATGLAGTLEYSRDLFFATTAARLVDRFQRLLAALVADPRRRISELPLLSPAERHELLTERTATAIDYPRERLVQESFEDRAQTRPDALAVSSFGQCLTYGELDRRGNRLARRLRRQGIAPEVQVAIAMEPGLDMIVAALAVLKAGGAYVPLDPTYPEERLRVILEDTRAAVCLTQGHVAPRLPRTRVPLLAVDGPELAGEREERPPRLGSSRNLAYVIYTSGSTGRPKGVQVEHRSVLNFITSHNRLFEVGSDDRSAKTASFAFDASVWEIWPYLSAGASVHIAGDRERHSPEQLRDWMVAEQITIHFLITPLAEGVLRLPWPRHTALSRLMTGGEFMWHPHGPGLPFELYNCYGPTETTVIVTAGWVRPGTLEDGPPAIGFPLANTRLSILGTHGEQVPREAAGELYIGGSALARGYGDRPALTAERFVPDPFSGEPGARLYRTGDRARYRSDASLDFLGRTDYQVKVRGFRIELGDIESALSRHPGVAENTVVVVEPSPGDRRLVAYVVPAAGAGLTLEALRRFLGTHLPSHMVPAAFVLLDRIPLTPNGKVDRPALPPPDLSRPELATPYVAPRTPVESALARVWTSVLGVEGIGVHDNFLEVGGDSILAIRICARVHEAGLSLAPLSLFRHPTIAQLAALAEPSPVLRAEQGAVTGRAELTPIQQWFFEQGFAEPWHFNQAALWVLRRPVSAGTLERALARLAKQHDALRLRFTRGDGEWEQTFGPPGGRVPFTHLDLSALAGEARAAALTAAAASLQASLGMATGPLWRAASFDLGPDSGGRLLVVIHHLVVDTVSWAVLLEDLETALHIEAGASGARLPPKTTSWQEWSARLDDYAATSEALRELDYWLAEGTRPAVPWPLEGRCGDVAPGVTASVSVSLTAEETRALLQQVPRAYRNRVDDVLLTALLLAFESWRGEGSGLRIDLEAHGREPLFADLDLSRTVGWFTSLYPVTLCRDGATEPGALLKAVKERLRGVPRNGVGFGVLRFLCPDPSVAERLRALPPAAVSFNYLGRLDSSRSGEGVLAAAPEPVGPYRSPRNRPVHVLEIVAMVYAGELRIEWIYDAGRVERERVHRLSDRFAAALRELIDHCVEAPPGGGTPSDFPLARLDQATLDRLLGGELAVLDLFPLSPIQLDMLVHTVAVAGSDLGVLQYLWRLRGPLDPASLRASWQRAIERHEILRSAFLWQGLPEPLHAVCRDPPLPWAVLDWSALPEADTPAALEALCLEDRRRGLPLERPPLLRLTLVRSGEREHHLLWTLHHLLLDGWGHSRLVDEVFDLYEALAAGREPQLPAAGSYRDFIAWLERQDRRQAEDFWRRALQGIATPTPLPLDGLHRDPADKGFGEVRLLLTEELSTALRARARADHLTLGALVQGAWALCLARCSGEEDVVFGITVSGRPPDLPGVETILGPFLGNVPLRVPVRPDAELIPWLRELLDRQVRQRPYEYLSQARIRAASEVPAHLPLYESMVVFENYPASAGTPGPRSLVTEQVVHFGSRTSSGLTLLVEPAASLPLFLSYDLQRFDAATAQHVLGRVRALLEGMSDRPDSRLAELSLLDRRERLQLLEGQGGDRSDGTRVRLPAALEGHAESTPDRVAVTRGSSWITHGELSRRAEALANRLEDHRPTILVLDDRLQPLPWGVAGEIAERRRTGLLRTGLPGRLTRDGDLEVLSGIEGRRHFGAEEELEAALGRCPSVRDVAVVARGGALVAYVVPAGEARPSGTWLRNWLRERVAGRRMPTDFVFLEALLRDAAGRPAPGSLPDPDAAHGEQRRASLQQDLAAVDVLEIQLAAIWESVFGLRPIAATDDFFELGGTSILAVELMTRIREQFGHDLPLAALLSGTTPRALAARIRERNKDLSAWSPLVAVKPGGGRRPFFCVHPAGGNVLGFAELARHFDPQRPFYALQAVGLDGVREPLGSVEEMAACYLDEIRRIQPRGPHLLGGFSFGGFVAFEMARQLRERGEEVALLALLDVWSPIHRGRLVLSEIVATDEAVLDELMAAAARLHGGSPIADVDEIRAVEPPRRLEWALERLLATGAMPPAAREHTRRIFKIHLSALAVLRQFVPRVYSGQITMFRASEEDPWLRELVKHPGLGSPELWSGWQTLTSEPLAVVDVPGNHSTMMIEPQVHTLASRLNERLEQAENQN